MSQPCFQIKGGTGVGYGEPTDSILGQEDCLYLSIWTPRLTPDDLRTLRKPLPVMVWIHGGGAQVGHGAEYTGAHLAASQDVVVVSINYRLNFLGWFSHSALRHGAATAEDRSGNYGTCDQIQALRWIRDNIASFGGDPDNVTLFGQSGGGQCLHAILQSPQAVSLFRRAIIISAAAYQSMSVEHGENFTTDRTPGHPLSSGELLLSLVLADGLADDVNGARKLVTSMSDESVAGYLRSKAYLQLLNAMVASRARNAGMKSAEGTTGWMSDVSPLFINDGIVIDANYHAPVPVIVGCNLYDDAIFAADSQCTNVNGVLRLKDKPYFRLLAEYLGKLYKTFSTDQVADETASRGNAVYVYRFDWMDLLSPQGDEDCIDINGATHGLDARFIFGTLDLGAQMEGRKHLFDDRPGSSFQVLSAAMMSYFSQFAASGDPGRGRQGLLPLWEAWPPSGNFIVLDSEPAGGIRMATGRLTRDKVVEEMVADTRLSVGDRRQRVVADLRQHLLNILGESDLRKILKGR